MLRSYATDALVALVVVAATLLTIEDEAFVVVPPTTWAECLIFVTAAAVLVAGRLPYVALAVTAVLDALPFWLDIGGAGYHLGLMAVVCGVTARRPPRQALPAVAAVLVAQVVLMAWDMGWRWSSLYVALAALTITFPAAVGLAWRSRAQATEALRQRAIAAERSRDADARQLLAEDRLRTARDLHDSVAHQIAVMNLNAGVASRALRERPDEAEAALLTVREAGRAVITSISDLLTGLRDGTGDAGPQHDADDLRRLVEEFRTLSPELTVAYDGPGAHTARPVSPVLYAVVREALTNAYKHGRHDAPVVVRIGLDPTTARVEVTNSSAEPADAVDEGFGLRGMRERVVGAGGALNFERDGDRFVLVAELPGSAS